MYRIHAGTSYQSNQRKTMSYRKIVYSLSWKWPDLQNHIMSYRNNEIAASSFAWSLGLILRMYSEWYRFSRPDHFWMGQTNFGCQSWSTQTKFRHLNMVRPYHFLSQTEIFVTVHIHLIIHIHIYILLTLQDLRQCVKLSPHMVPYFIAYIFYKKAWFSLIVNFQK